jgi:hypothetical protein
MHGRVVREVLPELLDVRQLALKVQFPADHSREFMDDRDRVVRLELVDISLGEVGEVAQDTEVCFDA